MLDSASTAARSWLRGPGNPVPSLDEVRAYFDAVGVARQKWPEELRSVDQFPRTPSGKIKKQELREQLRSEANA